MVDGDCVIGKTTSLRTGRSGDRFPVGEKFSAVVQTGPGTHRPPVQWVPVKRPGHGGDHPPPSSAEVKEKVELYLYSPSGPS